MFVNEPNTWLVLSSQTILIPVYLWYPIDPVIARIYLFLWFTSTWFHSAPSTLSHRADGIAVTAVILYSLKLISYYPPYSYFYCTLPYVYNGFVCIYGYRHNKYFFDTNLANKTFYHASIHILMATCLTICAGLKRTHLTK